MKICCISDTHGYLPKIKEKADILVIAGDICPNKYGPSSPFFDAQYQHNWILTNYLSWLNYLEIEDIVIILGNHDFVGQHFNMKEIQWPNDVIKRIHYLEDDICVVNDLKFYGSPWQKWFYDWSFNAPRDDENEDFLRRKYSFIPNDTDIIVSHGGVYGYGDKAQNGEKTGSKELLKKFLEVKGNYVITGHIHEDYGIHTVVDNKKVINASVVNSKYKLVNAPILIEV